MREGSVHEAIAEASDVDVASLVQRLWEARGYETAIEFSGPDVRVEATGETAEGATRAVRTWVNADGASERQLRVFASACDRDGAEPHVVAVGGGVDPGAVPRGVPTYDASGLAVELREAGVELGGATEASATDWLGDPVEGTDGGSDGVDVRGDGVDGDDGTDAGDGDGETEEIDRREAVKTVGRYVAVGFVGYVAVERLSDYVRSTPAVRTAVRREVADLRARLPTVEVPFDPPAVTNGSRVEGAVPESGPESATAGERPANATRIPYHELAADPASFAGTAVRYAGRVDDVHEGRESFRIRLEVAPTAADEWTDEVVCRWEAGALFGDSMSVHLLRDERVTVWGVVRGATEPNRYERVLPVVEAVAVDRAAE